MQDVSIKNLESKTGMSVGISLWYGTEITMKNKIEIQNLIAGSDVEKNTFARKDRPNHAPEVCGIRVIDLLNDDETEQIIHLEESCEINIECVEGHVDCDGSDENYATLNKKMSFKQCQKNDDKKMSTMHTIFQNANAFTVEILIVSSLLCFLLGYKAYYTYYKNERSGYTLLK